jgi:putative permease
LKLNSQLNTRQLALRRLNRLRLLGTLAILFTAFLVILAIENMLVSFILGFVIAYLLGPLVNNLERQGMDRFWATLCIFGAAGFVLGGIGAWVAPYLGNTFAGLQSEMPKYISGFTEVLAHGEKKLSEFLGPVSSFDLTHFVETYLTNWTQNFFDQAPKFVRQFITVMLLGPFLAFFMIKDGRTILRQALAIVPNNIFEPSLSILHQINQQIGYFVRARLLEAMIVGMIVWFGMLLIQMPYALLFAAFAGVTNLIPYIGPFIGAAPAIAFAMVNGMTTFDITLLAVVFSVAQAIDMIFLVPIMVAKIVNLHPVTVIIVIIAGAQVMGILGMIVSIPFAATLKVTIGTVYRYLTESDSRA